MTCVTWVFESISACTCPIWEIIASFLGQFQNRPGNEAREIIAHLYSSIDTG